VAVLSQERRLKNDKYDEALDVSASMDVRDETKSTRSNRSGAGGQAKPATTARPAGGAKEVLALARFMRLPHGVTARLPVKSLACTSILPQNPEVMM
jgi:hypothetical protein